MKTSSMSVGMSKLLHLMALLYTVRWMIKYVIYLNEEMIFKGELHWKKLKNGAWQNLNQCQPDIIWMLIPTELLSHMLRVKQIWLLPIPWWEGRTSLWLTLKMSAQETLCCDQFSFSTQLTKPNLSCNTPRGHAPQLLLKLIPFVFLHSWIWSVK